MPELRRIRNAREVRPGVWEVRVYLGADPATGNPRQKSRMVRGGVRAAEDAVTKLSGEVAAGKHHRAARGTLAELVDNYLTFREARGASPATMKVYRSRARIVNAALGHLRVRDVSGAVLDRFYEDALLSGRFGQRSPRSVLQLHAFLSAVFQQAVKRGELAFSPTQRATPPSVDRSEPAAPTSEEVRRLVNVAADRDPVLAVLLIVAATTGARRGELCGLRWSDVDLEQGILFVRRAAVRADLGRGTVVKSTKTDRVRRVALDVFTVASLVSLRDAVAEAVVSARLRQVDDPYVFPAGPTGGEVTNPEAVTKFFARVRERAGCPAVKLHHLRHWAASEAIAGGMDVRTVAGRLGHARPSMTLDVYGHLVGTRDRDVADHLGVLLASDPEPPD